MIEVTPSEASVDVRCSSASEFLHLVDPILGLFQSPTYMYRGVSSDSYGLIPSAHRDGANLLTPDNTNVAGPMTTLRTQCGAEFYTVNRFFSIAARHGIRLPEDSYVLREELDEWSVLFQQNESTLYQGRVWPSPKLYSTIALAQHYGVPTRGLRLDI